MNETTGEFAKPWRGVLSLACGLVAIFTFFVVREWHVLSSLGEPAGTVFHLTVTWIPVVLPICGFVLGVLGLALDRVKGIAIAGTLLNGLGLMIGALILYILAG